MALLINVNTQALSDIRSTVLFLNPRPQDNIVNATLIARLNRADASLKALVDIAYGCQPAVCESQRLITGIMCSDQPVYGVRQHEIARIADISFFGGCVNRYSFSAAWMPFQYGGSFSCSTDRIEYSNPASSAATRSAIIFWPGRNGFKISLPAWQGSAFHGTGLFCSGRSDSRLFRSQFTFSRRDGLASCDRQMHRHRGDKKS